MLAIHIPLALAASLLAALLVGPAVAQQAWTDSRTDPCITHCRNAGNCGQGVARELHILRDCSRYMTWEPNYRYGLAPPPCKAPNWAADEAYAVKYYWDNVCWQQRECVKKMIKSLKPNNSFEALQKKVLEQMQLGIRYRDEIRLARNPDYIKSINEQTDFRSTNQMLVFIAAGGKVDTKNVWFNPVYRRTAQYLKDTASLKKQASQERYDSERKTRDEARRVFVRGVNWNLRDMIKLKSQLRGSRPSDIRNVNTWIQSIHRYARHIRMIQEEAIQVNFFKKTERTASSKLKGLEREVETLRDRVKQRVLERRKLQLSLASDKKRLVDILHGLTRDITALQKRNC